MPRAPGHLPILGLWLLAAGLIVRLTLQTLGATGEPAHGFVAHYAASRVVIQGGDARRLYDDSAFVPAVQRYEPGVVDIFGANPPTVALTAVPLVALDYQSARKVWTLLSLAGWLLAVLWLARTLELGTLWTPGLLCIAAVFQPAIENLRHGQFHVLVLVLTLIAWQGLRRGRASWVGKGVGLALALKTAGLVFWPLLVVRREWRPLAWGTLTVTAFAVLSVVLMGTDAWIAFAGRAGETAASGSLSVTAYQTVPGFVRRLTVANPGWNPAPLIDAGAAGILLSWLVVAGLLVYSLIRATRSDSATMFAAFAALGLAVSPVSLDYHYVLAIFPAAVLLGRYRGRPVSWEGLLLAGAVAMIGLDLPYRSVSLADGGMALLAYPKLYGVLILWGLAARGGEGRGEGSEEDERQR